MIDLNGGVDPAMPLRDKVTNILKSAEGRMSLLGLAERPGMTGSTVGDLLREIAEDLQAQAACAS